MNWRQRTNRNIKGEIFNYVNSHLVVRHCSNKGTDGRLWEEDNILRIQRVVKGLSAILKLCGINKVKYL